MRRRVIGLATVGILLAGAAPAVLEVEKITTAVLPEPAPHWVWVNDLNFFTLESTRAFLFDGDTGDMLGQIPTGVHNVGMVLAPDRSRLYSPETYYPRGTRGERSDFLITRDMKTLEVLHEIEIPAKRASGTPHRAYQGISDDGRFVYVANMTPAASISVVDVEKNKFVSEIETAGCGLVYPTGNRFLAVLCGNGTVQHIEIDRKGKERKRVASPAFFEPQEDPLREGAARSGDTWYYVSFKGHVHPVKFGKKGARPAETWSLFSDAEREAGWRAGGTGLIALHQELGQLYVIVHQTDQEWTHKNGGTQVWVYDLASRKRTRVIELAVPVESIAVSQDAEPLLFANSSTTAGVHIHDARSGEHLRTIQGPAPIVPHMSHPLSR